MTVIRLNPFKHLLENTDYKKDDSITEDKIKQLEDSLDSVDERVFMKTYKFYEVGSFISIGNNKIKIPFV